EFLEDDPDVVAAAEDRVVGGADRRVAEEHARGDLAHLVELHLRQVGGRRGTGEQQNEQHGQRDAQHGWVSGEGGIASRTRGSLAAGIFLARLGMDFHWFSAIASPLHPWYAARGKENLHDRIDGRTTPGTGRPGIRQGPRSGNRPSLHSGTVGAVREDP